MAKGRTDARTDIYGLGATMYACLTGKDPAEAPARLLAQTGVSNSGASLVMPRRINPRISEQTERVVIKALELSASQRQQSAQQLRNELNASLAALTGQPATNAAASASNPATAVMGPICPHCGTQNRPDVAQCVNCNYPLRDGSAKRPAVPAPGGVLRGASGKQPVVGGAGAAMAGAAAAVGIVGQRSGKQPAVSPNAPNQRSGKQPAIMPPAAPLPMGQSVAQSAQPAQVSQRSGKQPAVATKGATGKQPAIMPGMNSGGLKGATGKQATLVPQNTGAMLAMNATAGGAMSGAAVAVASKPARGRVAAAVAPPSPSASPASSPSRAGVDPSAWIRFGTTPLSAFGKWFLALSVVEVLWGGAVITLGMMTLTANGKPLPWLQLGIGWLVGVAIISLLGGQALSRPIYRRGRLPGFRRGAQGFALALFTIVVHGVALWGASIFANSQPNATLAIFAYLVFGVNVLIVGILSVINMLA